MIDSHGLHPWLLTLAIHGVLKLGVLGLYLLWRAEHPNTKFIPWVRCILGDGHLAGTRGQYGGHRCIFCGDPLLLDDVAWVRHDRVRLNRDHRYTETTRDTWA